MRLNGRSPMRLNVGCGYNKIVGYVNIDMHPPNKPDIVADIRGVLPFNDNSVDEILMFHTIEHIEEKWHNIVLHEFWRVLKPGALCMFSYPEFKKCAQNYINNYKGQRTFWKNTIYGLQRYPGDYHVSLMDTDSFVDVLQEC